MRIPVVLVWKGDLHNAKTGTRQPEYETVGEGHPAIVTSVPTSIYLE
jgi:hypothetical protein